MENNGTLNWGKCLIALLWQYAGAAAAAMHILPTPVEDSTTLETEEGEETEALVEGGEVEAVKYSRNKYTLNCELRTMGGRKKPLKDSDGVISGTGAVMLLPENLDGYGMYIERASGRNVGSYTTADGGRLAYAFKAQIAPSGGDMCKWGTYDITGVDGNKITDLSDVTIEKVKSIAFTPIAVEGEEAPQAITIYTKGE